MTYLTHLTITSGHSVRVNRARIGCGEMRYARDLLSRALAAGGTRLEAPWCEYALGAELYGPALYAVILGTAADGVTAKRLATFGVARRPRDGRALWKVLVTKAPLISDKPPSMPTAPWCAVYLSSGLDAHREIIPILGDLEAALAWAWLERDDG